MATFFRNKVEKSVGSVPIKIIETDANTRTTVIGMSLTNITTSTIHASILLKDDTSVEGYLIKDIAIPANSSLRPLGQASKLILAPSNELIAVCDVDDGYDIIVSYVDIV
jgi:hypothetical protein